MVHDTMTTQAHRRPFIHNAARCLHLQEAQDAFQGLCAERPLSILGTL